MAVRNNVVDSVHGVAVPDCAAAACSAHTTCVPGVSYRFRFEGIEVGDAV